jgi:polar amino acid transport system substrate-binding protein
MEARTRRAVLRAALLAGCAAAWPVRAADDAVTLSVGWGNSPPYQFETPQGPAGLDIELMTLWARAAGVKLKWVRATWARQLLEAQAGTLDLMLSATPSDERRVFADFTLAYRQEHLGLVALAGRGLEVSQLGELAGRPVKIGVMRGMALPPNLAQAMAQPGLQQALVPMRGDDLTLAALRAGRLTYILGDTVSLNAHAARDPGEPVSVALAFQGEPVHVLVSRHAMGRVAGLLNRLNDALQRVRATPAWAQALARYPKA